MPRRATRSARPAVRDVGRPGRSARSVTQMKIDFGVRDLFARISEQEQQAEVAQANSKKFFCWPSWSMDTGLSPAQETFVEHWSPQRVLDESRTLRELVGVLQRWSSRQGTDVDRDDLLAILTKLVPR